MSTVGIVACVAALFLVCVFCLTRMVERLASKVGETVTRAVNEVLNPPEPEPQLGAEPAIPPNLMSDGLIGTEQDFVPEWERDFVPEWERDFEETSW